MSLKTKKFSNLKNGLTLQNNIYKYKIIQRFPINGGNLKYKSFQNKYFNIKLEEIFRNKKKSPQKKEPKFFLSVQKKIQNVFILIKS